MEELPRIRFINHAGYLLQMGEVRLLADPWIEGRAFNDCWGLISPTSFTYEDFRDVTHLWFSHEHPDHFAPANLKKIPEQYRRRITVLYQQSKDRRVVDWCRANGFGPVVELPADKFVQLVPGCELLCGPAPGGDSWLLTRTPQLSVLNLNDCLIRDRAGCARIRDLVGPIDVLLTQFSIAAWDGNPEEVERRRRGAQEMLEQAVVQTQVLQPKYVVPFASFVWFCHEDNFYMNEAVNHVDAAAAVLASKTAATPVVLYPGDTWVPGEPHDNAPGIRRYLDDHARAEREPRVPCREATEQDLTAAAARFQEILKGSSSRLRLRLALARQAAHRSGRRARRQHLAAKLWRLAVATFVVDKGWIHLHDLDASYCFDPFKGLRRVDVPAHDCDIVTNSQSLCYAFRMQWGGETMLIAGTFKEVRPGARDVLFSAFEMAKGFSLGERLRWRNIPLRLLRRLRREPHLSR